MISTPHALGRMAERLSPADRQRVSDALARVESRRYRSSVAVRVARLSAPVGTPWGAESNGSDVWAVVRDGAIVTVMLRRKQQPTNPAAFGVERVILKES